MTFQTRLIAPCILLLLQCAQFDAEPGYLAFLLTGSGSSSGNISWGNSAYNCRQQITMQASSGAINQSSLLSYAFDHASLVAANKSLASGDDIRAYYGATEIQRALKSGSSWNNASTAISLQAQADIASGASDSNYYIYYCNPAAAAPTVTIPAAPSETTTALATQSLVNNTAYTNIASSTFTPSSTAETWLWFATYSIRNSVAQANADSTYMGRVTVNGVADVELEQQNNEGNRYKMMVAFGRITGTIATQTIGLDIKSAQPTTTTDIKDVRITSVLMPSDADFQYAVDDTQVQVTQGWSDIASPQLTFTPASAGDYLILATGQHHENPNSDDSEMRFLNHDGTRWPQVDGIGNNRYSANGRGAMDSFFVARRESLSASSKTFKFQFRSSAGGTQNSNYKGLRIAAFRMDAFDSVESQVNLAEASTTSTAAVTRSSLTTSAPPASRDYLIIQSAWIYDNDGSTTHQTLADFQLDGATLSSQDHVINRADNYQFASGCISSLTTANSHTFTNRYWTNNAGIATYIKESVIHALRFKAASASGGAEETK